MFGATFQSSAIEHTRPLVKEQQMAAVCQLHPSVSSHTNTPTDSLDLLVSFILSRRRVGKDTSFFFTDFYSQMNSGVLLHHVQRARAV